MSRHTHGAWFLDQYGHVYGWDVPQPHMGTSTSVHVCTPVTNFADRALIAAAPDLLAVLQDVADFWAGGDVPEELDARMREVINKATGSKPC